MGPIPKTRRLIQIITFREKSPHRFKRILPFLFTDVVHEIYYRAVQLALALIN